MLLNHVAEDMNYADPKPFRVKPALTTADPSRASEDVMVGEGGVMLLV